MINEGKHRSGIVTSKEAIEHLNETVKELTLDKQILLEIIRGKDAEIQELKRHINNLQKIVKPKYPFNEGDDYWTIEGGRAIWSCWDEVSKEIHDEYPNKIYFKSQEEAENYLNQNKDDKTTDT